MVSAKYIILDGIFVHLCERGASPSVEETGLTTDLALAGPTRQIYNFGVAFRTLLYIIIQSKCCNSETSPLGKMVTSHGLTLPPNSLAR